MSAHFGGRKRNKPKGRRTAQWMSPYRHYANGEAPCSLGKYLPVGSVPKLDQNRTFWENMPSRLADNKARNEYARERKGSRGGVRSMDASYGAGMVCHHA